MDSAVRSGYYLKDGLANNQDFYYINTLITITADSQEELEWRTNEMKKLMLSQDLILKPCYFRQDLAFASVLPFNKLHKGLHELSKRNVLTTGAASCYPYVSFEMSDDNGILLCVNKYNNSLISIYGIPAVVIHGDSITVEEWSRWYTPAYVWGGWVFEQPMGITTEVSEDDFKLQRFILSLLEEDKEKKPEEFLATV